MNTHIEIIIQQLRSQCTGTDCKIDIKQVESAIRHAYETGYKEGLGDAHQINAEHEARGSVFNLPNPNKLYTDDSMAGVPQ